jgi:asparagine synthetase B (glutamine-hydrolysing)
VLHHLLPRTAARWLVPALAALPRRLGLVSLTGATDGTVREQVRRYADGEHLHWGYGALFTSADQERLLNGRRTATDPFAHIRRRITTTPDFHERPYLDQLTLIDLMLGLPERLLMRVDKATMLYGVEARVPFLDPAVVRVAFDIPPGIRAPEPKAFLKAYARTKLPAAVVARRKVGFPTSPRIFMASKVLSEIREAVFRPRFVDFVGFERAGLEDLFAAGGGNGMRSFYHVWSLYVLSLWFHHWIEGND